MPQCSVLRVNEAEERAAYVDAVADIIRNILADHKTTLAEISERTDMSLGTVSNAANKKGVLNPLYLGRFGTVYGAHYLDPYVRLSGGRVVPLDTSDDGDVLPIMAMATALIAAARSPSSPGGVVETLNEQLGYLPNLRRLQRELGAQISRIEARRDAA